MNSELFNKIGIPAFDPAYLLIGGIVLWIVLLICLIITNSKLKKMTKKYEVFMSGADGVSLEDAIIRRFSQVEDLLKKDSEKQKMIADIQDNLLSVYQKIGIVKYDAFNEMGGKLSFALALLDKENNGFVMNAMHSREGCYTYIKEIIRGESYILLGEEEKEAVEKAINVDNYME
jgi:hypothetical protein